MRQLILILSLILFCACAKKAEIKTNTKDIKEQVETKEVVIPFAKNKAESDEWHEKYFAPILKDSKVSKNSDLAKEYETFNKLFFADLSQMEYENALIDTKTLAQSVVFTYFSQEFMREYLFINQQNIVIAPWSEFNSKINFKENIESSHFVLQIAQNMTNESFSNALNSANLNTDSIRSLQNKSYINFNNAVLGNSLLKLSDMYYDSGDVMGVSHEITGLTSYQLPQNLESLLYYRILYFKYHEKFESNYLLDRFAFKYSQETIEALHPILQRKFNESELKSQFRFPNFEPTNPISISQCKGGSDIYPFKSECIKDVFLKWIIYLEKSLKGRDYVFPIYIDSKLCLLIGIDKNILYPQNTSEFCALLYRENNKRLGL